MQFPLFHDGLAVEMHIFDGVFDRNDLGAAGPVDLIQQGCQRSGFAAAGGSGHQDQALTLGDQIEQDRRQRQCFRRRDGSIDHAGDHAERTALEKAVHAEPRRLRVKTVQPDGKRQVEFAFFLQFDPLPGSDDAVKQTLDILTRQHRQVDGTQFAVQPEHRPGIDRQMQIAGLVVHGDLQKHTQIDERIVAGLAAVAVLAPERLHAVFHAFDQQIEFVRIAGGEPSIFQRDLVGLVKTEDRPVESGHTDSRTAAERVFQIAVIGFRNGFPHGGGPEQKFHRGDHFLRILPGDEPLGNHRGQRDAEVDRGLSAQMRREQAEDTLDGLDGVGGVKGGDDQMAGQSGAERGGDRFQIAHFSDDDHVRIFAHGPAHGFPETHRMGIDLPLGDPGKDVLMQIFDRVFQRKDMAFPRPVDLVDERGHRGRFAAARGPGHQDQAAGFPGQRLHLRRQLQSAEFEIAGRVDHPDRRGRTRHRGVEVEPEPFAGRQSPGRIGRSFLLIKLLVGRGKHPDPELLQFFRRDRSELLLRHHLPVDPHRRDLPRGQEKIRDLSLIGISQYAFDQTRHIPDSLFINIY